MIVGAFKNLLIDFCEVKMIAIEIMIDDKEYYHTIGNFSVGDKAFLCMDIVLIIRKQS